MMRKPFAVLDFGCRWISAVAAVWSKNGEYKLEGLFRMRSHGIHKGTVTDPVAATGAIAEVMEKLRVRTGRRMHDVYAGVSSASVEIVPSSGVLLLSKYGREISEADIKKCIQIGATIKLPLDKYILHRIVCGFSIDGEAGITKPLRLEGVKLGVSVNILTINSSVIRNMSKCIAQAGFVPAGFVFSGLAASYRTLTEEDMREGVALLDICNDMTEVMFFQRGVLVKCNVIFSGIEQILTDDGCINKERFKELGSQIISSDGWEMVHRCVVIGEGAFVENFVESLEGFIGTSVVPGTCITKPFEDLPPEKIAYIAPLGILDHLRDESRKQNPPGNFFKKFYNRILTFADKYF